MSCTEGNRFGSACSLRCSGGFQLEGEAVVTCGDNGKWNGSIGSCQSRAILHLIQINILRRKLKPLDVSPKPITEINYNTRMQHPIRLCQLLSSFKNALLQNKLCFSIKPVILLAFKTAETGFKTAEIGLPFLFHRQSFLDIL